MSLPLPNLDTRSYADLVKEARARIPVEYPGWTDHNPADPGVVLVELFAWLTEMALYRVNRVSDEAQATFLKLLNGPGWQLDGSGDLTEATRRAVASLRERFRAVTADDFEYLALHVWPTTTEALTLGEAGRVRRAHCLPRRDLEQGDKKSADGHISLVVVPDAPATTLTPQPSGVLLSELWRFLDERRLLGTRHHVVGPKYLRVVIAAKLQLRADVRENEVRARVALALQQFFHPLQGGPQGQGWPLGRAAYVSEVYDVLDRVAGVDFVQEVQLGTPALEAGRRDASREIKNSAGQLVGIALEAHELVEVIVPAQTRLLLGTY